MNVFKDLIVWQKSISFVTDIYKITTTFPKEEMYGLTNQIRRAAVSIPSNIAEGASRGHSAEFVHFLFISLGSSSELETQLTIAKNLGFIQATIYNDFIAKLDEIEKMLMGLIKTKKLEDRK